MEFPLGVAELARARAFYCVPQSARYDFLVRQFGGHLTNEKIELSFTSLDENLTVSTANAVDVNLVALRSNWERPLTL
jgi:hypothetical protein